MSPAPKPHTAPAEPNWNSKKSVDRSLNCNNNYHLTGIKFDYDKCEGAVCRGIIIITIMCSDDSKYQSGLYGKNIKSIGTREYKESNKDLGICGLDLIGKPRQGVMGLSLKYCSRPQYCPVYTKRNPNQQTFDCIWENECDPVQPRHQCHPESVCHTGTGEGYKCKCNAGYKPNTQSYTCNRNSCNQHICTAVACPSPKSFGISVPDGCQCSDGLSGVIEKTHESPYYKDDCNNINECADGSHNCENEICKDNTPTVANDWDKFECICETPDNTTFGCILLNNDYQGFECKHGCFYDSVKI